MLVLVDPPEVLDAFEELGADVSAAASDLICMIVNSPIKGGAGTIRSRILVFGILLAYLSLLLYTKKGRRFGFKNWFYQIMTASFLTRYEWTLFFLFYYFALVLENMQKIKSHETRFKVIESFSNFVDTCSKKDEK